MKLEHPFLCRCQNYNDLLIDVTDFKTFISRIEKLSKKEFSEKDTYKYKGNCLEIFSEFLIKMSPVDMRIGITDYTPITVGDTGVDGVGKSILNLRPITAQIKYRQYDYILTANADHLSNFTQSSLLKYGVKAEDDYNMLIITTGKGLNHFTDNDMFLRKVRVLNRKDLALLTDNNLAFWLYFLDTWARSLDAIKNG